MKKIFQEYGGVITVAMAVIALICIVALLLGGPNGGWIGNAFHSTIDKFGDKVDEAIGYEGTVTPDEPETEHVYTAEEIAANDHLYAIGATKAEYVVAKFNDDYTELTIFANGDESDGKIASVVYDKLPDSGATIKSVVIEDGVTTLGSSMFFNCKALESVTIANTVTKIGNKCFQRCKALTSVVVPDSVTDLGNYAFSNCTGLTSLQLSKNITEVKEYTIYGCYALKTIVIPDKVTAIGEYAMGTTSKASVEHVYIPESVTSIADTAITIPTGGTVTVHAKADSYAATWAEGKGYTVVND